MPYVLLAKKYGNNRTESTDQGDETEGLEREGIRGEGSEREILQRKGCEWVI
jgi:hypothetical protein